MLRKRKNTLKRILGKKSRKRQENAIKNTLQELISWYTTSDETEFSRSVSLALSGLSRLDLLLFR